MIRAVTSGLVLVLAGVVPLRAQEAATTVLVDRIVAVVGDRPILISEIEERVLRYQATQKTRGTPDPTPEELEELRRAFLTSLIDEELVVQAAQRDTMIKIVDAEVTERAEAELARTRAEQTEEQFTRQLQAANFVSIDTYRRWLVENTRRQILQESYYQQLRQQGKLLPIPPTEDVLRKEFERRRADFGKRPPTVSLRQVVVRARADSAARVAAFVTADSIRLVLRRGGDFAELARKFSADPSNRERGGELGWFKRGMMLPAFENVAFRMRPKEPSFPVETSYGFHVIEVLRRQPTEIQARHILIKPKVSDAQRKLAEHQADSVAAALREGRDFDSLARRYHDPEVDRSLLDLPVAQLPPHYQQNLEGVKEGDVAVFRAEDPDAIRYFVVQLLRRDDTREWEYNEVRDQLSGQMGQDAALKRLMQQLRNQTYVDVRWDRIDTAASTTTSGRD